MSSRRACSGDGTVAVQHVLRQHALGEIVQTLEIPAARGRDVADPEQPFEDFLALAPAPPAAFRFAAVGELARAERAALADLLQRGDHQRPMRRRIAAQAFPGALAVARTIHAPAKQRIAARPAETKPRDPSTRTAPACHRRQRVRAARAHTSRNANTPAGSASAPARSRNRSAPRRGDARSSQALRHLSVHRPAARTIAPRARCGGPLPARVFDSMSSVQRRWAIKVKSVTRRTRSVRAIHHSPHAAAVNCVAR